jgi:ribosomal protein L44E
MSTKHIRTTADLVRFGAGLRIECASCGAARTVDGFEAGKLAGVQPIEVLRRRLRCSRCGTRDAQLAILPPV